MSGFFRRWVLHNFWLKVLSLVIATSSMSLRRLAISASVIRLGISSTHGWHVTVQKFITTIFPR